MVKTILRVFINLLLITDPKLILTISKR